MKTTASKTAVSSSASGASPAPAPTPPRSWPKRIALGIVAIAAACAVGFYAYTMDYYRAGSTSDLLADAPAVSVMENDGVITLDQPYNEETAYETDAASAKAHADNAATEENVESTDAATPEATSTNESPIGVDGGKTGIVLYPGAKVDPHAYAPLAQMLTERGYLCAIVKMPFNLAFFGIDSAQSVMAENPHIEHWWIAGHSLGGAMAAQFASGHANELDGIFFLASYAASDLSATNLAALSISGSEDTVLNRESAESNRDNLPARSEELTIEGGNHAGFGVYGPQEGDGEATIPAEDQQRQTAEAIDAFIRAS